MNLLDTMLESLGNDPEVIPVMRSKGTYIDQDPIEDLRFLSLRSHVSESGVCISHVWNWGVEGTEIVVMMHIIDGHEEEFERIKREGMAE